MLHRLATHGYAALVGPHTPHGRGLRAYDRARSLGRERGMNPAERCNTLSGDMAATMNSKNTTDGIGPISEPAPPHHSRRALPVNEPLGLPRPLVCGMQRSWKRRHLPSPAAVTAPHVMHPKPRISRTQTRTTTCPPMSILLSPSLCLALPLAWRLLVAEDACLPARVARRCRRVPFHPHRPPQRTWTPPASQGPGTALAPLPRDGRHPVTGIRA